MIALGSNYIAQYKEGNIMQDARYESGLDNSPMYDCAANNCFFNTTTHLMELYDVGMNGMVLAESDCLVELAQIIGRDDVTARLNKRSEDLRKVIRSALWMDELSVYANKFKND